MVPREAMAVARSAAVMVRVHGPDPKGRKMRNHAFHHSESGVTTLSASGWLLSDDYKTSQGEQYSIVLTCASIVEPFLQKRQIPESAKSVGSPKLISGAELNVLLEDFELNSSNQLSNHTTNSSFTWLAATLICLVDVPLAGAGLQALLDAHGGSSDGVWEVGWSLAQIESSRLRGENLPPVKEIDGTVHSENYEIQSGQAAEKNDVNLSITTTRIALLGLRPQKLKFKPSLILAEPSCKGDFLFVIGSPFGALSPLHFFNSMVVGITSNRWPPGSMQSSLLMADIRCLPGMEGAPTFNKDGALVGILAKPLRQRGGNAEVQLVITWEAIAPSLKSIGYDLQAHAGLSNRGSSKSCYSIEQYKAHHVDFSHLHFLPAVEKVIPSVVLVTVGDGAWASGVLVNNKGLVLTNAHLLEPWRFGKTQFLQSQREKQSTVSANNSHCFIEPDNICWNCHQNSCDNVDVTSSVGPHMFACTDNTTSHESIVPHPTLELNYRSYRKLKVRLDHPKLHTWCDARVVYISRGPLDVALLQLEIVPPGLQSIQPEEECPIPGTPAIVIGHGLFGPRSELCPSLSAGVVSRVVRTENVSQFGPPLREPPVMLETTAAVHPGGSGGAVVNEHGRMIGLVTSNARHSGGTVIPHLNFSIPYAALKPIFVFASGDMKDLSSLSTLGNPNGQLSAVWALVPPTPRPPQVLPITGDSHNGEGSRSSQGTFVKAFGEKGSRFAKFLSEHTRDTSKRSLPRPSVSNTASENYTPSPSDDLTTGQIYHNSRL